MDTHKFKVGDKVVRKPGGPEWFKGSYYVVEGFEGPGYVNITDDDGDCYGRDEELFDLYKELSEDVVTQPHYADFDIEPLEFIERNNLPFWAGNVIKYVCRWDRKGEGVKDLRKARDYLDKKIAMLEGKANWLKGTGE